MHNGMLGLPRGGNREILELNRGPGIGFTIAARYGDTGLGFPVATFRPTTDNVAFAMDFSPKGTNPVEFPGNGFTWLDVMDADIRDTNANNGVPIPVHCARVAMTSTGAQFGCAPFNGATALPIEFLTDYATVKARMTGTGFQYGSATRAPVAKFEVTDDTIVSFLSLFSGEGTAGSLSNHPFSIWTNNTRRAVFDTSGNFTISSGNVVANNLYASGGSLKTLQTVDTTNRSTASTSFIASGVISPSLTPGSSSNKVLVQASGLVGAAAGAGVFFKIYRSIGGGAYADVTPSGPSELQGFVVADQNSTQSLSLSLLDSPATGSTVQYQIYFRVNTSTGYLGRRGVDTLFNSPTIITVTEIKG